MHGKPTIFIPTIQAAEILGYTPGYVAKLIRGGKLKASKVGRSYIVNLEDVENFIPAPVGRPSKEGGK